MCEAGLARDASETSEMVEQCRAGFLEGVEAGDCAKTVHPCLGTGLDSVPPALLASWQRTAESKLNVPSWICRRFMVLLAEVISTQTPYCF